MIDKAICWQPGRRRWPKCHTNLPLRASAPRRGASALEQEKQRAEQEKQRAEVADQRAAALAAELAALGINPTID
ncbi:MAG: hypothetical protein R6W76_20895 [Caldilinea sp.]